MIVKRMKASFGRLQNATLELNGGFNLIEAPNEAGKSTWSAFLRAMLYGIPTKERDRQGYIAEKNRYQPWSGAPMEGSLDLIWRGEEITLRRGPKGNTPFGKFEAVYTATGQAVPELTADNAGEVILGVPREVFERSAFVGQGGTAIDGAPALERRVATLVSSGEEEVSYSEAERRLRDWLNRRRHNKTGLIPRLENELSILNDTLDRQSHAHRLAEDARREMELLGKERDLLAREVAFHRAQAAAERRRTYEQARAALEEAENEVSVLRAELTRTGTPPDKDTLRRAQEELNYILTLTSNIKLAETQSVEARQAAEQLRAAAADPLFPGLSPSQALEQADQDADEADAHRQAAGRIRRRIWIGPVAGLGLGLVLGGLLWVLLPAYQMAALGAGVASLVLGTVISLLACRGIERRELSAEDGILSRYGASNSSEILARAEAYRTRCLSAEEAGGRAAVVDNSLDELNRQRQELKEKLLTLAHTFAPTVTDTFGISAAISRALGLEDKLATAEVRLEGARRLAASVPRPEGDTPQSLEDISPRYPYQETAARLAAVKEELNRLGSALAMAQGELNTLGDPALFQMRREALIDELDSRRTEYDALALALDCLERANGSLQARFSPALNRRAGEIMSALTGGRYDKITLTREFEATAEEQDAMLPRRALTLSRGTMDQLYLAVRLAVCDLALPNEETAPLILDDALANFDDRRMELALDYLCDYGAKRQVLLFTCHTREGQYLAGNHSVHRSVLPGAVMEA